MPDNLIASRLAKGVALAKGKKTSGGSDTTAEPTTPIKSATTSLSVVPSRDKRRQEKAADSPASPTPYARTNARRCDTTAPHAEP